MRLLEREEKVVNRGINRFPQGPTCYRLCRRRESSEIALKSLNAWCLPVSREEVVEVFERMVTKLSCHDSA
jgi:hypothetical protein